MHGRVEKEGARKRAPPLWGLGSGKLGKAGSKLGKNCFKSFRIRIPIIGGDSISIKNRPKTLEVSKKDFVSKASSILAVFLSEMWSPLLVGTLILTSC